MKKIVFAIMIGLTTSVYGQLEYISRDGYEKIGEYRYNDRTGHIEYYEPQKLGRKDVDNWSNLLAAAYSANVYSAMQKARLRDEYMLIAYRSMKRAGEAMKADDYRTMRKEAWNAYIYYLNVQKMVINKSDLNNYIAGAYIAYLGSLQLLGDKNKFIEMYDYNIIKYHHYYEEVSFFQEIYSEIIRERNRKNEEQRLERERIEKERLKEEKIKEEYNKNFGKTYKGEIKVYEYTPLYEQPDMSSKEIYRISDGKVLVLEKVSNGKYYKVRAKGKIGYIFTGFIKQ